MSTKQKARDWLVSVVAKHVPSNTRQYKWGGYFGEVSVNSTIGLRIDLSPVEGKVVDENDDFWLIKTSRTDFFVLGKAVCRDQLEVGASVKVTPYSRKYFDGHPFSEPRIVDTGGIVTKQLIIGEDKSTLPVDKNALACTELAEMIRVIEEEKADNMRTVSQVLIDAGACQAPLDVQDVVDGELIIERPPRVKFRINSKKHVGWLGIEYDRAMDCFAITLIGPDGTELERRSPVFITPDGISELGRHVIDLVDDGDWWYAKIDVLKPAPKKRRIVAS